MEILFRLLTAIEVIVCIMLIAVVLVQRSKGGAGLSFGGVEAALGARVGNVLTRTTVILGIIFLVNTIFLAMIRPDGSNQKSSIEKSIEQIEAQKAVEASALTQVNQDASEAALDMINKEIEESSTPAPEAEVTPEVVPVATETPVEAAKEVVEEAKAEEVATEAK